MSFQGKCAPQQLLFGSDPTPRTKTISILVWIFYRQQQIHPLRPDKDSFHLSLLYRNLAIAPEARFPTMIAFLFFIF